MDSYIAIVGEEHPLLSEKILGIQPHEYSSSIGRDSKIHQWLLDLQKFSGDEIKGVYIDAHIGASLSAYLGFRLALHVRLTRELGNLRFLPIVIMGMGQNLTHILEDQNEKTALIALTPGTRYAPDWETAQAAMRSLAPIHPPTFREEVLEQLVLARPTEYLSNHSITNQWGAYRLDWAANTKVLNPANQPVFRGLYFKYLLSKGEDFSAYDKAGPKVKGHVNLNPPKVEGRGNRILLIDDEADKGWGEVLKAIFSRHTLEVVGKEQAEPYEAFLERARQEVEKSWDLVLLDLRLTPGDHEPQAEQFEGANLLEAVKKRDRSTSVIMFTASTQAMNYESLIDAGADGYFVKEGIEHAADPTFARKNYERFCETVNDCLHKSEILRPFWTQVDRIERGLTPTLVAHEGIRARIVERLRMFFGLLKKSFELTSYDQETFFYSAQELAFMTLWSVLNEVQHAFIEKGEGGKPDMIHASTGKIFMKGNCSHMKISDRLPVLLERPELPKDREGKPVDMRQQLYRAIQFVLLNHSTFQHLSSQEQKRLLKRVESINRLRNKLYLIHGDDRNQSFFDYTQEQKRGEYHYYDNILLLNSFWLLQVLSLVLTEGADLPPDLEIATIERGDEFECTISNFNSNNLIAYVSIELIDQTASIHIKDVHPRPDDIRSEFSEGETVWLRVNRIIPERIELETPTK